jgi:hypothetical protein
MTDSFENKGSSSAAEEPKKFLRNPSLNKKGQNALVVVQDLSWGSFFPLVSIYLKRGAFSVYYQGASRGGLQLGTLLFFLKITVSAPLKINDLHYIDTPNAIFWNTQYQVVKACLDQIDRIETIIDKYLPKCTKYIKKLLASNVSKTWQLWLLNTIYLRLTAKQLAKQEGISLNRVFLISRYSSLLKILNLDSTSNNEVSVIPQPNQNRALLYTLLAIGLCALEVIKVIFSSLLPKTATDSSILRPFKVGVAAAWGIDEEGTNQMDDFHWWRGSSVAADRLIYMFERENIQPTSERVNQVQNLGIESVALNQRYLGGHPNLLLKNINGRSFLISLKKLGFALKLSWNSLAADDFSRAVTALVGWQYFTGRKLSDIYKTLNIKGIFHFDEVGMDLFALASTLNDSIRIGTHWASHTGINITSCRNHQVYFLWGRHDAQLVMDSGSTSKALLISGSFINNPDNMKTNNPDKMKIIKDAQIEVNEMRKRGVRYILTLLDSSVSSPEFYRFFLEWLVEDPCLGLLIKNKGGGRPWNEVCYDGLNGLVDSALKTNRIYRVSSYCSPSDVANLSDFAVAVTSISALVVAAIDGARVIFLDYERVDQGPQKPYCILHSLGLNRCVFYEPEILRKSILGYFENPTTNPHLGDATPVLDQLDPFRDGKASQRIGEFVAWYLEELENGSDSDDAVRHATEKYAKIWGEDKVFRNS